MIQNAQGTITANSHDAQETQHIHNQQIAKQKETDLRHPFVMPQVYVAPAVADTLEESIIREEEEEKAQELEQKEANQETPEMTSETPLESDMGENPTEDSDTSGEAAEGSGDTSQETTEEVPQQPKRGRPKKDNGQAVSNGTDSL